MTMLQHIWQGLCDGVLTMAFLLLNPFVSFLVLLAAAAIVGCLRGSSKGYFFKVVFGVSIVFGGYSAFNIADYLIFRNCGALAISPINQFFFQLFCSPRDFNEPYVRVELLPRKSQYTLPFVHKYAGMQSVALMLVNTHPEAFDYDHPDVIDLSFSGKIEKNGDMPTVSFEKQYATYFLCEGENDLPLFDYEVDSRSELKMTNRVSVTITGDLAAFLRRYPGSYLCVRNVTTK